MNIIFHFIHILTGWIHCCELSLEKFLSDWWTDFMCRWFETHHQAETVGPVGGVDWQVRVAPRGSRVLCRLPDSHAGTDPWEESHSCRVLAPPLACPLVETSSHCTFPPSHSLQRLQQITFQFGHIRWIFIFTSVSSFWIPYILLLN